MAREALRLTPETVWGTYNGSNTPIYCQLDGNNQFTPRIVENLWNIRSAGGYNRRVQLGSSTVGIAGNLGILLYGSQAPALMNWVCNPNAALTQMPSMTADHLIQLEDSGNTYVYQRYLGMMVQQGTLTGQAQQQLMRLNLQLIGKQPATITGSDFPQPAFTDYPSDAPYVFQHLAGGLTFNNLTRAEFEEVSITWKNMLDPRWNEAQYPTRIRWCGRDTDFEFSDVYAYGTDRTTLYQLLAPLICSMTFTNGAHSMALNFETKSFMLTPPQDTLDQDKVHYQKLSVSSFFDGSAGTDFALTIS